MRECVRWSEDDDAYLAVNYPRGDLQAMSRHLGRTIVALKRRAQTLKIVRPHPGTRGNKYPNRARPMVSAKRAVVAHPLYEVCAGWVR